MFANILLQYTAEYVYSCSIAFSTKQILHIWNNNHARRMLTYLTRPKAERDIGGQHNIFFLLSVFFNTYCAEYCVIYNNSLSTPLRYFQHCIFSLFY